MTPNPLHGAIDETQPHSATEGGMSEKPTMREVLGKIATWMETQAAHDRKAAAQQGQFLTLRDAYLADAKNYEAMAKDARAALAAEEESGLSCAKCGEWLGDGRTVMWEPKTNRCYCIGHEPHCPPSSKDEP